MTAAITDQLGSKPELGDLRGGAEQPAVAPPRILNTLHFTFTNRCNLRCTYCPQGSHADEFHADTNEEFIDQLVAFIKQKDIAEVGVGYYGELLLIKDWWKWSNRFLDLGCSMTATSSFSRVLEPEELATFARFRYINLSIDTHDIATLKAVRKSVDAKTIIYNTLLLRAHCLEKGIPEPHLIWSGVMHERVAPQLAGFVAMAAAAGIRHVQFNDVTYYRDAKNEVRNVSDLSGAELIKAVTGLQQGIAQAQKLGVHLEIQGVARIITKLQAEQAGHALNPEVSEREGIQGIYHYPNDEKDKLPAGHTRGCISPWTEVYLDPKGDVYPCCAHGTIMGRVGSDVGLEDVLDTPTYRELRRSIYTGEGMNRTCTLCPVKQAVPIAEHQAAVDRLLAQQAAEKVRLGKSA